MSESRRSFAARLRELDARVVSFASRHGMPALRMALALVFLWFGILKLMNRSPAAALVAETLWFLPPASALQALGVFEVLVGLGLLTGWAIRVVLLLFAVQMAGTFLVLIVLPGRAFQEGNPFLLSLEGEFVVKNLVLLAAGLVIASTVRKAGRRKTLGRILTEKAGDRAQ